MKTRLDDAKDRLRAQYENQTGLKAVDRYGRHTKGYSEWTEALAAMIPAKDYGGKQAIPAVARQAILADLRRRA